MSDHSNKEIASNADDEERRTRGEYRRAAAPGLPPPPQRSSTAAGAMARYRSTIHSPIPMPGILRARIMSSDLLLQDESAPFDMSPAMHRRRELTRLALASSVDSDTRSQEEPIRGRPRMTRQRSFTSDEHGIKAKKMTQESGADFGAASRPRGQTWTNDEAQQKHGPSSHWEHVDAFQAMGSLFQQELYQEKSEGIIELLSDKLQVPLLIILVGLLSAVAGMVVHYLSSAGRIWRISRTATRSDSPFLWLSYASSSLFMTLAMCAVTQFVCPSAAGGGVPEMKAVLSGAGKPGLLSAQLVVVKMMGVIVANTAGLSVGKEGPLIHITCAIADLLMTTPLFKKVRMKTMKRLEVLACACAAGVAATFGSVFGGTLFSVEVTATAYMVETLPTTFFCAVVVSVVFWMTGNAELFTLISDKTAQAEGFTPLDLMAWSVLGMVCGLVGAAFVAILDALSKRRNYFTRTSLHPRTRRRRMFVVVGLCTLLVIPASLIEAISFSEREPHGRDRFRPVIDQMYSIRVFGVSWYLFMLLAIKVWTTVFSVIQPLPVGLFSPVFIIGGLMGRIFGELALWMDIDIQFKPWEFALIGSAAFSAGVTRAVSTAVIVFELCGENHLRLPLGVALMISYFIAQRFTKGIYDALMDTNGTPYLPEVHPESRNVPAEDVMIPVEDIPCLSLSCTAVEASALAMSCEPGQVIPVVQALDDKVLVGVVLWNDLAIALADHGRRDHLPPALPVSSSTAPAAATAAADTNRYSRSSSVSAAAAAAAGRPSPDIGQSGRGERAGEDGVMWPRLTAVASAIRARVGWLPRHRMAEPALLEQLDLLRTQEDSDSEDNRGGDGGRAMEGAAVDEALAPLGPGIPWAGEGGGSYGAATETEGESTHYLDAAGGAREQESSSSLTEQLPPTNANGDTGSAGERNARPSTVGQVAEAAAVETATAGLSGVAKRTPLRYFLVREGHKFVPVGRSKKRKGGWRELEGRAARGGVPVVLDPSPYQVTHTTELSKVDMAFRLLRLDNAYVCNAGRLVGVVTRDSLRRFMGSREVTPMDECMSLFRALSCCIPSSVTNYYAEDERTTSNTSDNSSSTLRHRITEEQRRRRAANYNKDNNKNNGGTRSHETPPSTDGQQGSFVPAFLRRRAHAQQRAERLPLDCGRSNHAYSSVADTDEGGAGTVGGVVDEKGSWNPV